MKVTHVALRPMEASEAAGRPSLTPELLAASGGIDSAESQLQDNFEPPLVSDRIYTIYSLVDPYTSQIRYVGITSSLLRKRLNKHITVARQGDQRHISRWIQKVLREGKRPLIVGLEKTTDPVKQFGLLITRTLVIVSLMQVMVAKDKSALRDRAKQKQRSAKQE
jgi:hypothetical protein